MADTAVVLLTGMSGGGKSAALAELARLGYRTVDADDAPWIEYLPVPDSGTERMWCEDRMAALLDGHSGPPLFVAGCVANQRTFYPRFDAVVLLSAPVEVLLERVAPRETNPFGKTAAERTRIIRDTATFEPVIRAGATAEIDTRRPLDEVVAELVSIATSTAKASSPPVGAGTGPAPRSGSPVTPTFLDSYHARRPGVTEQLFAMVDPPHEPYRWLVEGLADRGPVLDVCCGSAPLHRLLAERGYVGVDRSPAELAVAVAAGARVVAGDARALPVVGPFPAVSVCMALMLLPLEEALAEFARVLAPGGVLAALVPSLPSADHVERFPYGTVLDALGRRGVGLGRPLSPYRLASAAAAAGLSVTGDEVRRFDVVLDSVDDARLMVCSFYAPDATADHEERALAAVRGLLPTRAPYPLRRILAARAP